MSAPGSEIRIGVRHAEVETSVEAIGLNHRLTFEAVIDDEVMSTLTSRADGSDDVRRLIERALNTGLAQMLDRDESAADKTACDASHATRDKHDEPSAPERGGSWGAW